MSDWVWFSIGFYPGAIAFLLLWWRICQLHDELEIVSEDLHVEKRVSQQAIRERDASQKLATERAMEAEALQQKLTRTEQQFSQMQAAVNDLCDRWKPKPPGWTFPNEPIGTAEGR